MDGLEELADLRRLIFDGIAKALAEDGHCKSYEGAMSIQLPNYFEERDGMSVVTIRLDCYVLGPRRHYSWQGHSLRNAAAKARRDVERWLKEDAEVA